MKISTRILGTLAGAVLLAGAATTPASAAGGVAPDAASPSSVRAAATQAQAVSSTVSGARAAITCTPQVQYPHKSTHVPGTVNVVVTLSCTAPVSGINIRAALYRNGALVRDSGQKTVSGTSFASHNAAEPCHNATYQGWMSYGVAFPPGYVPPTGASSGFGPVVNITC